MFKYVKYILVVMVLGMGLIAFNQIVKADNEVVDVGENISFRQIDPEQAKQFMDSEANYVILDVRTKPEYEDGHIKNAISLPNEEISPDNKLLDELLSDKEQMILVYCRSGRRSTDASIKLAKMGYVNVYNFGGIVNWPYEIVK